MAEELETERSAWEVSADASLQARELPVWAYKARAVTYAKGHRGLLDFDLRFPEEYLKGPALDCYVWKKAVDGGTRVHAYADVDGRRFHLKWQDASEVQNQPIHQEGPCLEADCKSCLAAEYIAAMCRGDEPFA